jgi:hypothetical protein
MNRKRPAVRPLSFQQSDIAVSFYDAACDYPKESFEQITKRLAARGFGKSRTSAVFKQDAREMFTLAR